MEKKYNKERFSVGGSKHLKAALIAQLREAGIPLYEGGKSGIWKEDITILKPHTLSKHVGWSMEFEKTHYTLPKDWEEALRAFKDFYKEEKSPEKGKWYCTTGSEGQEYLFRFKEEARKGSGNVFYRYTELIRLSAAHGWAYHINDSFGSAELIENTREATAEEISRGLLGVAAEKGYKKGVKVKSAINEDYKAVATGEPLFGLHSKGIFMKTSEEGDFVCIYHNGQWAEILSREPELTIEGHQVVFQDEHIRVGCQSFNVADINKLYQAIMAFNKANAKQVRVLAFDFNTDRDSCVRVADIAKICDYYREKQG
jgi:hypothetical protein